MTVFQTLAALATTLLLTACQPETAEAPEAPQDFPGLMSEADRKDCINAGSLTTRGLGNEVCAMPTPDAGASCRDGSDCTGHLCLAKGGGTCAPRDVMFGCFEILESGQQVTICID